jgi:lupus La protein
MSAPPVESIEPDPAATSLPNDDTVIKPAENGSAPTDKDAEIAEAKAEQGKTSNGAAKAEEKESAEEQKKDTSRPPRRQYAKSANHSKYDPAVLEASDDAKAIRAQVGCIENFIF